MPSEGNHESNHDHGPRFDPTINLGHLLTLSGVIVTIIAGWYSFDARLSSTERQIGRLVLVVETSIRQEEQIKSLTVSIAELKAQLNLIRSGVAK